MAPVTQAARRAAATPALREEREGAFVVDRAAQAKPLGLVQELEKDVFELGRHVLGYHLHWDAANKFLYNAERALGLTGSAFEASGPVKAPGTPPKLTFRGGAVLKSPVVHNLYVGDYFNTKQGQADVKENDAYAQDFGQSRMMEVAAQYGAGAARFGGSTVLGGSSPTRVTEADIQRYVKNALASGEVSKDAQGIYTVVLPPNTILDAGGGTTSQVGLGGFHGSYADANGQPVYYAAIAYSDSQGNGINFDNDSQDAINITESHEWMEAMTDPDVNSPIPGRGLAWYDDNGGEIGDLAISQLPLDQSFERDANGYLQQLEWSNSDQRYEIATDGGIPPPPPPPPSSGGGIC